MTLALSVVTLTTLRSFHVLYNTTFNLAKSRESVVDLVAQYTYQTFATVLMADNRVKILHLNG